MDSEILEIKCAEWRALADENPNEMEVVMDMMIEAEVELCSDDA